MSLIKKIKDYYNKGQKILFTTPSHNQGMFVHTPAEKILGKQYIKYDLSEIDGLDNLQSPHGVIKDLQSKISDIYNSKASFILTNGSTSGIISAMFAVLKEGDKVLTARNCHISVYKGLVLTGATPVWFMPEFDENWGIFNGISAIQVNNLLKQNTDIKALIITSPTYEGSFSEIEKIAEICKNYGVILIVDEAHGALYNFADFKIKPAIQSGADISVQSLHKTAGAPNPCALLHVSKESSITAQDIQNSINLTNTTSPSYPMLCACEAVIKYLDSKKGRDDINKLLNNISQFKNNLPQNIEVYNGNNDPAKLLVKIKNTNPEQIAEILYNKYNIEEEFTNNKSMLFICGIGTDKRKLTALQNALISISSSITKNKSINQAGYTYIVPEMKYTPREAYFKKFKKINVKDSLNKVCAQVIVNYPPGIPVLLPGEVIHTEAVKLLNKYKDIEIC